MSQPAVLPLTASAYLSPEFDSILDGFRNRFGKGFAFSIIPSGSTAGVIVVTTQRDLDLAREIVAVLESVTEGEAS